MRKGCANHISQFVKEITQKYAPQTIGIYIRIYRHACTVIVILLPFFAESKTTHNIKRVVSDRAAPKKRTHETATFCVTTYIEFKLQ